MNAVADNPAITPARRIDGSNRVITTNQAITPTVAAHRGPAAGGRSNWSAGGQDERHVLSGHGSQMRQAAGPEPVDHVAGLVTVVTDHEPAIQRAVRLGNEVGRPLDRRTDAVGGAGDRAARCDVARPVEIEAADDVLPGDSMRPLGVEADALAVHVDPLTAAPTATLAVVGHDHATTSRSVRPRAR